MDGVEINENKDNNILNSEESKRESIFSINISNSKLNRIFNSTKIVNTYINSPELDLSFKSLNESSKLSSERDDALPSVITEMSKPACCEEWGGTNQYHCRKSQHRIR